MDAAAGRRLLHDSFAGHEGNAALAAALRPNDPALLHYRSGGFYCARARQVPGVDPVRDVLLGVAASADEPIAGGPHKVFGRAELAIVPQTSTIASHLPRALGVALGIGRATKLGVACPWPRDAVTLASFGDASASHSTAVGAINAACHTAYQGIPAPLLLVCEDNGIGISVPTPPDGWRRRSGPGRACTTWRPTAATRSRPTTRRPGRSAWSGPGGGRRSCTCRWSGSSAMRAATRRRPTARPLTWPPTSPVTRW